jgi:CRP-like cAMP-binding protein
MVRSSEDRKRYAEILGSVPAFQGYSTSSIEQFVAEHASEVTCPAGGLLAQSANGERRLIVVDAGSAVMWFDDDVCTVLHAGDYFGGTGTLQHAGPPATAIAITDVHAIVIGPQALAMLPSKAHPSRTPVLESLQSTAKSAARTHRRRRVLVGSAG